MRNKKDDEDMDAPRSQRVRKDKVRHNKKERQRERNLFEEARDNDE
jgi:hypothetical protein